VVVLPEALEEIQGPALAVAVLRLWGTFTSYSLPTSRRTPLGVDAVEKVPNCFVTDFSPSDEMGDVPSARYENLCSVMQNDFFRQYRSLLPF
jgi:hypothetical protein